MLDTGLGLFPVSEYRPNRAIIPVSLDLLVRKGTSDASEWSGHTNTYACGDAAMDAGTGSTGFGLRGAPLILGGTHMYWD